MSIQRAVLLLAVAAAPLALIGLFVHTAGATIHGPWGHDALHAHPGAEHAGSYTCPMHPEVESDKPGKCPKCGMKLVPSKG